MPQSSLQQLQQKIAERVRAIDPDDAQRGQKSTLIFLESVLRWEYGEGLLNDPRFFNMLDEIQSGMESDPAIRNKLKKLIEGLLV